MIITTTPSVEGRNVTYYKGLVMGEAVIAGAYESKLNDARKTALRELEDRAAEMGANGVLGVSLEHTVVAQTMMMVCAVGTAVVLGQKVRA